MLADQGTRTHMYATEVGAFLVMQISCRKQGGLMQSASYAGSCVPASSIGRRDRLCVVFFGKTLLSALMARGLTSLLARAPHENEKKVTFYSLFFGRFSNWA